MALAFEQTTLVGVLVEMLSGVGHGGGQLPAVAECTDLLVGLEQALVALVKV